MLLAAIADIFAATGIMFAATLYYYAIAIRCYIIFTLRWRFRQSMYFAIMPKC